MKKQLPKTKQKWPKLRSKLTILLTSLYSKIFKLLWTIDISNSLHYLVRKSSIWFCSVQIFQMNKCSACDTSLQLPAIHFLCKHSYHAHCLESYSEKANYCPACVRDSLDERFVSTIIDCKACYYKNLKKIWRNFHAFPNFRIQSDKGRDFSTESAYIQFQNEVYAWNFDFYY